MNNQNVDGHQGKGSACKYQSAYLLVLEFSFAL